jgi:hypothetical protein
MKAKDYRIGNLVEYDDRVFEIHSIADTYPTINTSEFGIGVVEWYNIKPIKITEEWLLGMGFRKDNETDYRWLLNYNSSDIFAYDIDDNTISVSETWEFGKRMYVHELQNLFYALTKEELKINIV